MKFSSPIVIFGAGSLGRRVAQAVHPVLFCDNNSALWGSVCEGIPVESPEKAVERYPNATFIIAIWHPIRTAKMMDRVNQLKSFGAASIISFPALFNDYADILLPHGFWERTSYYVEHDDEIRSVRALLDSAGREEFDRQMRLRLGDVADQVMTPESNILGRMFSNSAGTRSSLTAAPMTAIPLSNFGALPAIILPALLPLNLTHGISRH